MKELQIKRLRETATIPTRATSGSAGYDLYANLDTPLTIAPHEIVKVPTGIAIGLPSEDMVAYIFARSGLATKHGITLANCVGVIDSDYRGEILVALINQGKESYTIQPNERIAQMVISPIFLPTLIEAETLEQTERGAGGFGSTS